MSTIWTIGHSNHEADPFLALLRAADIGLVVDVRSSPYSRFAAWANRPRLEGRLADEGLAYAYRGDVLGGKPEADRFYDGEGHVRYDRLAATDAFAGTVEGLAEAAASGYRMALLCAEEDPTGCHRRLLVGRVLHEAGVEVVHLRGDGRRQTEAELRAAGGGGQMGLFGGGEKEAAEEVWRSVRPLR